tara:strand:+ start:514 stop:1458 length:945 start_codon:yes stop_codon:yes gene_type:complete
MIKTTKKFLILGFGGMGCRHAQSLINSFTDSITYVFEPNDVVFEKNINLIGQQNNENVVRLLKLNQINDIIDLCVIATSAGPRFDILKELLGYKIKNFILEKVVFQNNNQFEEILNLTSGENIYINFVNRYFENYVKIKEDINNQLFSMDIIGSDFSLGSNALHYFDLFKYFGANRIEIDKFCLKENPNGNKRGSQYKEILGQISIKSCEGSTLNISSESLREGGVEIIIKCLNKTHIINESLLNHMEFRTNDIKTSPLLIEYTSSLTGKIFKDILDSKCLLPTLDDTKDIHSILFESVNKSLNLKIEDICPIT